MKEQKDRRVTGREKLKGKKCLKKINIWVISSRWGQSLPKGLRLAAPTHPAP